MGSYTIGFASDDNKGKKGRWTMNPYVFDNTYFQEVLVGSDSRYLKTTPKPMSKSVREDKKTIYLVNSTMTMLLME